MFKNSSSFNKMVVGNNSVAYQVIGAFDRVLTPIIRKDLFNSFEGSGKTVILDLAKVTDMDNAGIAMIVECLRISEVKNFPFRIIGINRKVKSVFERLNLSTIFERIEYATDPDTHRQIIFQNNHGRKIFSAAHHSQKYNGQSIN